VAGKASVILGGVLMVEAAYSMGLVALWNPEIYIHILSYSDSCKCNIFIC
jgi:hypothetical protein